MGSSWIENYVAPPRKPLTIFASENSYKYKLEKEYFPHFFDGDWKPIKGETKEKNIRSDTCRYRIDYYGLKDNIPTYVEVKNDRIRQRYLLQIVRYYCDCNEECDVFNLYVICSRKIRPRREKILKKLNIKILDLDDILEGRF